MASLTLTWTDNLVAIPLMVWAAPPQSAGDLIPPKRAFTLLKELDLIAGSAFLETSYQAKYGPLLEGQQIWIKLVPINPQGLAAAELIVSTVVVP